MATQAPLTEDALTADRFAFWKSFNSATVMGIVFMVVLLILGWAFLT
jgi:hypothetical protein